MAQDSLQTRLREFVAQADQMHRFLQNELRDARGRSRAITAQLELIQFYGAAFGEITRLLAEETVPDFWQAGLLEEAVRGRTLYWEWQRQLTSLLSPLELYQLQAGWDRLTELVQAYA